MVSDFVAQRSTERASRKPQRNQPRGLARELGENQALQSRLDIQSRALSNIVHELRDSLVAANGYAHFLAQGHAGLLTQAQQNHVAAICKGTRKIKDLLAILSHLADGGRLQLVEFSLPDFLMETIRTYDPDISLRVGPISNASRCTVVADPRQLGAALQQLLTAVLKVPRDRGGILLETIATERHVTAVIRGTALKPLDKLDQEETAADPRSLSLALAREIIYLHGGVLTLRSQPSTGAEVTIALPAWKRANEIGTEDTNEQTQSLGGG